MDMKLEVLAVTVTDVDRANHFYLSRGWRLEADVATSDDFRVVQPGSPCSIIFGTGITTAGTGPVTELHLAVTDIDAARTELTVAGVEVSEVFHDVGGVFHHAGTGGSDPDGNEWWLQEITARLPGELTPRRHSVLQASSRTHFDERRPLTENTRTRSGSLIRTGRLGTPNTWWPNTPVPNCPNETPSSPRAHRPSHPRGYARCRSSIGSLSNTPTTTCRTR